MKKMAILGVSAMLAFGVSSCGHGQPQACADTLVAVVKGSPPGGGSSGGGGSKSGGSPSGGSKSGGGASSGGSKSGSGSGSSGGAGQSKTAQQARASSASKPTSKPDATDVSKAKTEKPSTVSRGGSYTSPVTNNVYVFHSSSYYRQPGYIVDIYDIYNPYNYWYYRTSPFYGMPFSYANGCGGQQKQVTANAQDINITIDNDGKVVSAEDKNPKDPDLEKSDPNDTQDPIPPSTEQPATSAP